MQGNPPDRPEVIALPPLILAATITLGLAVNYLLPASFLPDAIATPLGLLITLGAIALALLAIREMFAANTPLDVRKPSTGIVTSGVFRMSRNPIYLGMLLLCIGVALLANSLWVLGLVLPLAFVLQKGVIEPEEAYLERKFGDKYLRYKVKVRRWI
ncbi:MAG: isoprenylcysteine carboxylmethyltransferase family protein [Beijerinckiaceae bacterium]|nr:isoprenylcysteine carboxylmethyltransferase family protein [Beijerinckiaceae bacterium]MCI0736942.1 isoprenylcysteine carboxylmethyltransferase family protein [Beijerinckiaceae bacterium]